MVLNSKHIQSWKEAKGKLNTVESWSVQTFRHLGTSRSVTLRTCALGVRLSVKSVTFPIHLESDFAITRMITDRIGRHELLIPLLNPQEV